MLHPRDHHVPAFEYPEPYHAEVIRFLLSDPNEPADQGWR